MKGRYLTNGQVTVTSMTVPGQAAPEPSDYFDLLPFTTTTDGATDSTFKFTASLKNTIPPERAATGRCKE